MKLILIIRCECFATTELSLIILNGHNIKFDQCTGTRLLNVINFTDFVNFWKVKFTNFLLCFVEKLEDLYAFSYNPLSEKLTRSAGWALFDIQSEYARMGLPNSEWCCSTLNKDYKVGNIFNVWISAQPRISACPHPSPPPCFHSNKHPPPPHPTSPSQPPKIKCTRVVLIIIIHWCTISRFIVLAAPENSLIDVIEIEEVLIRDFPEDEIFFSIFAETLLCKLLHLRVLLSPFIVLLQNKHDALAENDVNLISVHLK